MGITIQADGIDKQTVTVPMGGTLQLRPVFKPDYATVIDPVWQSDDETIATVSSTGMVTGVKTGTTSITVFSEYNPEARDQVTINVEGAIISIDKALVDQSEAD
jgi:alpha-amylase